MKKVEIFKAPWCTACPDTKEIENLGTIFDIQIFDLQEQENMNYANKLGIRSLPTFIVESTRRYFNLNDLKNEEC